MNKLDIKTVTVVGANGTMGANVSAMFASFGSAKVYMVSRDIEKSRKAIEKAVKSVKADCIREALIPADYSSLSECVSKSDLVFESVAEDMQVKLEVTQQISEGLRNDAVVCSGTSGLSVNAISEVLPERHKASYFGIHFFNPPYNMPLCEFIKTNCSDNTLAEQLKKYLRETLLRTVVDVKDSPAFLANRIGFQFINEAIIAADIHKEKGGIDYIDSILGTFTGRNILPIATADFVGLDIHKSIIDNLYSNTNDFANQTFVLPNYISDLITNGALGKKTSAGLYKAKINEDGIKRNLVYDINTRVYRDKYKYAFPFAQNMVKRFKEGDYEEAFSSLINSNSIEGGLCLRFLLKYIVYSFVTAKEVSGSVTAADDVMSAGFNWVPPVALYNALSLITDVRSLVKEFIDCGSLDVDKIFADIPKSAYDFRRYFKAFE